MAQIYSFAQKKNEFVCVYVNHLRQYISRCLVREMLSPQRLISLFLEGLRNQSLHANIYGKKTWNLEWMYQGYNRLWYDNCEIYGNVDKKSYCPWETSSVKSGKTQENSPVEEDTIANLVVKKMNQVFRLESR